MDWVSVCSSDKLWAAVTTSVIFSTMLGFMLAIPLAYFIGSDNDGTQQSVRFRPMTCLKITFCAVLFGLLLGYFNHRHGFCELQLGSQVLSLRLPLASDRVLWRDDINAVRLAFPHKNTCGVSIYAKETRFVTGDMLCQDAKALREQLQLWRQTGNKK